MNPNTCVHCWVECTCRYCSVSVDSRSIQWATRSEGWCIQQFRPNTGGLESIISSSDKGMKFLYQLSLKVLQCCPTYRQQGGRGWDQGRCSCRAVWVHCCLWSIWVRKRLKIQGSLKSLKNGGDDQPAMGTNPILLMEWVTCEHNMIVFIYFYNRRSDRERNWHGETLCQKGNWKQNMNGHCTGSFLRKLTVV